MRIGQNPQKHVASDLSPTLVRIFVIVYVPHLSSFFSEMPTIIDLCLDSLERTVSPHVGRITLISNGSCVEVENLLYKRQSELFDQIVINRDNLGKINGLLSIARGALEEVIVVSDSDVLFSPGWLEEILQAFCVFPEAATVAPLASPWHYLYENRTLLVDALLKRELAVAQSLPLEDFNKILCGSTNPDGPLRFLENQVTVTRNGYSTGISGAHQCVAIRRDMLKHLPEGPCRALLGSNSVREYIDQPPDLVGYWRLSTLRSYAFHMGNTPSDWMYDETRDRRPMTVPPVLPRLRRPLVGRLPYWLRRKAAYLVYLMLERRLQRARKGTNANVMGSKRSIASSDLPTS